MKYKTTFLLLIFAFVFCITACGEGEAKRPLDCPGTKWTCSEVEFVFSISNEKQVTDATVVDKNGNDINVSIVFSETEDAKMSVSSVDGSTMYLSGECVYRNNEFTLTVTDLYDSNFSNLPVTLHFSKA